jgi:hypothetical protein
LNIFHDQIFRQRFLNNLMLDDTIPQCIGGRNRPRSFYGFRELALSAPPATVIFFFFQLLKDFTACPPADPPAPFLALLAACLNPVILAAEPPPAATNTFVLELITELAAEPAAEITAEVFAEILVVLVLSADFSADSAANLPAFLPASFLAADPVPPQAAAPAFLPERFAEFAAELTAEPRAEFVAVYPRYSFCLAFLHAFHPGRFVDGVPCRDADDDWWMIFDAVYPTAIFKILHGITSSIYLDISYEISWREVNSVSDIRQG